MSRTGLRLPVEAGAGSVAGAVPSEGNGKVTLLIQELGCHLVGMHHGNHRTGGLLAGSPEPSYRGSFAREVPVSEGDSAHGGGDHAGRHHDAPRRPTVSYTHLTLPTKRIV